MRGYGKFSLFLFLLAISLHCFRGPIAKAGPYLDSAHGSSTSGVNRSSTAALGYSQANCAHCHEQHASVAGAEPGPSTSGAEVFSLFAPNYSLVVRPSVSDLAPAPPLSPYNQSDNMCFYCHNSAGSAQAVDNDDFSQVFGGAGAGVTSILAVFNQISSHDLTGIADYAKDTFSWFGQDGGTPLSNPCSGCHNPHLAKRNWSAPADPTLSAISKPSDHENLYGPSAAGPNERLDQYAYAAPYSTFGGGREPAGTGLGDGSDMPDYVGFCLDCHANAVPSTRKGGNLRAIDWSATGDKHGGRPYQDPNMAPVLPDPPYVDQLDIRLPYVTTSNYVLSCLDCHEPHGSPNLRLIRRRVNGGDLANAITTYDPGSSGPTAIEWKALCERCHNYTGTNYALHHSVDESLGGTGFNCFTKCHNYSTGSGGSKPCMDCHYHGSTTGLYSADPALNLQTKTF